MLHWDRSFSLWLELRSEFAACMFLIWHMHCFSRAWIQTTLEGRRMAGTEEGFGAKDTGGGGGGGAGKPGDGGGSSGGSGGGQGGGGNRGGGSGGQGGGGQGGGGRPPGGG